MKFDSGGLRAATAKAVSNSCRTYPAPFFLDRKRWRYTRNEYVTQGYLSINRFGPRLPTDEPRVVEPSIKSVALKTLPQFSDGLVVLTRIRKEHL